MPSELALGSWTASSPVDGYPMGAQVFRLLPRPNETALHGMCEVTGAGAPNTFSRGGGVHLVVRIRGWIGQALLMRRSGWPTGVPDSGREREEVPAVEVNQD